MVFMCLWGAIMMSERSFLHRLNRCWLFSILLLIPLFSHASNFSAAGAHSAWVVMNEIKPSLEKISGHKISLFGKQSMLGVGCNAGIKSTLQSSGKQESFGMVCCPLSDTETAKKKLDVYPLALEPIMILNNISNPINDLSLKQVRAIFSGQLTNWNEVGGEDKAIVVVTRLHCKKRPGHWKTILDNADKFSQKRINVQSADEMVKRVSDFKAAFGHAGTAWLLGKNSKTKIVRVNGFLPTSRNLKNGNYPFYRQLSIITQKDASNKLKALMHKAQQEVVNNVSLLEKYQLLPIHPISQ